MKRMISASSRKEFPDVWSAVNEFGEIVDSLKIETDYMDRRTEDESSLEYDFKTPEQAEAYIDALELLAGELKQILDRFKQISMIED